jgi:purine nucleoside phosphorylase
MSTPFWGNIDSRRLARAYVALAFAQDVAKGYVKEHASAQPILSALEMSAKLIEEILEDVLPEEEVLGADDTDYTELTM